jgi:hypothetical protein
MKTKFNILLIVLLSLLIVSSSTASAEKKWTVMVYLCADNNLDFAGVNDLNELELSGSDENINIIVLLDRLGMDDTHLYYVVNDPDGESGGNDNNTISPIIDTAASSWLAVEEDMGNPQTLKDFLIWTLANYPAEHYLLSIWDHGSGIFKNGDYDFITKGECWDDNGGIPDDYIDLEELKDVMASASSSIGRTLDIVGHDVCLGGQFETHYQVRDYVDISIASADSEPFDGWDYEGPFVNLKANPDMTPEELAYQIVEYYYNWYGPYPGCCNTQAAVDLRVMLSDFMPAFETFNETLVQNYNDYPAQILFTWAALPSYNVPNYDLWNFAEVLAADATLPQEVRDAALNLIDKLELTFIHYRTANYTDGHGCTIWFPNNYSKNPYVDEYQSQIDMAQTNWTRFLRVFAGEFIINTAHPADGFVGMPYYQEFTAFNGTPPFHWEKVIGQYPYGLSLTDGDTAVLSGIPNYATEFSFTLKVTDASDPVKETSQFFSVLINPPIPINGDANGSGEINISDVVYLLNYIFMQGPEPDPYLCGDVNCDGEIRLVDVIYLINYIFRGGPPPCQSF